MSSNEQELANQAKSETGKPDVGQPTGKDVKPPTKKPSETHFAQLESIDGPKTGADSHAQRIIGYYVIIGCGTAAVVNHTTLRQTRWGMDRINRLPVMHIGFKDPWATYYPHGMGQPPYLLTMPGYHNRPGPGSKTIGPRLLSKEFAANTQTEWSLLESKYKKSFEHRRAWVAAIESKTIKVSATVLKELREKEGLDLEREIGKSGVKAEYDEYTFPEHQPPYRLILVYPDKRIELVYAYKIDICVGAGRPTLPPKGADWQPARTKLWIPPELWDRETRERKLITGPEALCEITPWDKTHRNFVYGAGGIGLNMVERAEGEGCYIDWLPNILPGSAKYPPASTLHRSFNLRCNDMVLKHPNGAVDMASEEEISTLLLNFTVPSSQQEMYRDRISELAKKIVEKHKANQENTRDKDSLIRTLEEEAVVKDIALWKQKIGFLYPPPSPNIPITRFPGRRMEPGEADGCRKPDETFNTDYTLNPGSPKWRFARNTDVTGATINSGKVDVAIKSYEQEVPVKYSLTAMIRDYDENEMGVVDGKFPFSSSYRERYPGLDEKLYDHVYVCIGLGNQPPQALGLPMMIAEGFQFSPIDVGGRMVGLQTADGTIRVLGAAATMYPNDAFQGHKYGSTLKYFQSLPVSAVPPGFIFNGVNIATANHYFDQTFGKERNANVNTATVDDLTWFISWKGLGTLDAAKLALAIVKYRRKVNGYQSPDDIKKALKNDATVIAIQGWEEVVDKLQTDYREADKLLDYEGTP